MRKSGLTAREEARHKKSQDQSHTPIIAYIINHGILLDNDI